MTVHRPSGLGCALFLLLATCSQGASILPPPAADHQLSKLVSIRVAGFVEAAGIT